MTRRALTLGLATVASLALTLTPLAASAATPQDPATGQCHVDISLSSHKVKLDSNSVDAHVTGTVSNPNNCDLSDGNVRGGFALTGLQHGGSTGSGLDDFGNLDFDWSNDSLAYNFKPVVGVLTPTTDMEYIANGASRYNMDAKWGKVVIDNAASQQVDVRFGSRTKLTATRSGKSVTLRVTSTRFEYSNPYAPGAWGVAYQPKVTVQKYVKGAWHSVKNVTANHNGAAKVTIKSAKATKYRAVSQGLWYVWSSTSKTVKK